MYWQRQRQFIGEKVDLLAYLRIFYNPTDLAFGLLKQPPCFKSWLCYRWMHNWRLCVYINPGYPNFANPIIIILLVKHSVLIRPWELRGRQHRGATLTSSSSVQAIPASYSARHYPSAETDLICMLRDHLQHYPATKTKRSWPSTCMREDLLRVAMRLGLY